MPRRRRKYSRRSRYRYDHEGDAITAVASLLTLSVLGFLYLNRDQLLQWSLVIFFLFVLIFLIWFLFKYHEITRRRHSIIKISARGLDEEVENFISRFGNERSLEGLWGYRDHYFDWQRLEDFRKMMNDGGVKISLNKWEDTLFILRHFIQLREEMVTRESIKGIAKKLDQLDGYSFEALLYRLFTAAGYHVEKTGHTGDQGADLILNHESKRIAVQAKRYKDTVGNKAVQEAIAAQHYYNCHQACVVTTSQFSESAKALAKASNVNLFERKQLQDLLLKYLKETWI